jgi:hypothetical protein
MILKHVFLIHILCFAILGISDMYFLYQLMCLLSQAHDEAGRQRSEDLLQRWGGGGAGGVLHLHPQP